MSDIWDVLEALGGKISQKTNITEKEIAPVSMGLAAQTYRDKCAKFLDQYNENINNGEDVEEWFKELVKRDKYPLITKDLIDNNLEVRHSWNGWMVERKFGYGALAKMSESSGVQIDSGEIRAPVLNIKQEEAPKKKHWWSRGK